jgi:microcystin-dependent protein
VSSPFLSELRIMSFNFAPKSWALCNGQLLPINQNQALFSLLGTTYGGDGRVNFGLPNLQGRVPIHMGSGFTLGQLGGEVSHTVNISEMAQHNHAMTATAQTATEQAAPNTSYLGQAQAQGNPKQNVNIYGASNPTGQMAPAVIGQTGGSQPHANQQPFLVLNVCIALQGIFPSQN